MFGILTFRMFAEERHQNGTTKRTDTSVRIIWQESEMLLSILQMAQKVRYKF